MKAFSIVIANYNQGCFLESAIMSILKQGCQNFELIVIDGASTDDSLNIINKYKKKIKWWISEPDKGQSDALNKGFKKAEGEYYLWLNADDLMLPGTLGASVKLIKNNSSCKWISGDTIYFDESGLIKRCLYGPFWNTWLMKRTMVCNMVNGPSSIFHHSIFKKAGGLDPSLNYAMDMDLWMKFADMGIPFYKLHRYIWAFRIHHKSKTSHSIGKIQNDKFKQEVKNVISMNKRIRHKNELFVLRIFKILTGTYFRTLIDTCKWQNTPISNMINNNDEF